MQKDVSSSHCRDGSVEDQTPKEFKQNYISQFIVTGWDASSHADFPILLGSCG